MNSTLKNILVLLIILTFAFSGYYIFVQNNNSQMAFSDNEYVTTEMLANTQLFIQRRNTLSQINIDTSLFEDPKFISYKNFTQPIEVQPVGKDNPFSKNSTSFTNNNNF